MNEEYDYIVDAFTQDGENTNLEVNNLNVECITSTNNNFSLDSAGNLTVKSVIAQEGLLSYQSILNFIYPVGSIYITVSDVNPAVTLGGTWEQIKDKFLLCAGDTYAGGTTGGSATHSHTVDSHTHTSAAHTHGLSNGYAMLHLPTDSSFKNLYVNSITTSSWTDTYKVAVNGVRVACSTQNTSGVKLGGNTVSTTPAATGAAAPGTTAASSLPPYTAVYVWKRTA